MGSWSRRGTQGSTGCRCLGWKWRCWWYSVVQGLARGQGQEPASQGGRKRSRTGGRVEDQQVREEELVEARVEEARV